MEFVSKIVTPSNQDTINLKIILECFSHSFYNPHHVEAQLQAIKQTLTSERIETAMIDAVEVIYWYGLHENSLRHYISKKQLMQLKEIALLCYVKQNHETFNDLNLPERLQHPMKLLKNEFPVIASSSNLSEFSKFIVHHVTPFMKPKTLWTFIQACTDTIRNLHARSANHERSFTIPIITWHLAQYLQDKELRKWHDKTPIWIRMEQVRSVFKNLPLILTEHDLTLPSCGISCKGLNINLDTSTKLSQKIKKILANY